LHRKVSTREAPQIFYRGFRARPAIFLGIMYSVFASHMRKTPCIYALIACTLLLRVAAVDFKIDLAAPREKMDEHDDLELREHDERGTQ